MSQTTVHDIVSNADTIIYLKNPCTTFADWNQAAPCSAADTEMTMSKLSKSLKKKKLKKIKALDSSSVPEVGSVKFVAANTALPENGGFDSTTTVKEENPSGIEQSLFGGGASSAKEIHSVLESVPPAECEKEITPSYAMMNDAEDLKPVSKTLTETAAEGRIQFRVCAGNLMSASPWFNRVLTKNGWMESNWDPEVRWFRIAAEDWDEEALVILMNVFHLRNHRVPRAITLEMLAKIAVLADYYECSDSIQLFVDIWLADLQQRAPIPMTYCRDLILWLWISWALRLSETFEQVTSVIVRQSTEPVRNLALPIPSWITDELDLRRYRAIGSIVSGLNTQLGVYRSTAYSCPVNASYSFRCGSMLLGALTKEMDSAHFLVPRPEIPYMGQSFDAICDAARTMKSETWYHSSYAQHHYNLSTAVFSIVDSAIAGLE